MRIKRIESAKNPALEPLLLPKRREAGQFAIEGPNLLEAALDSARVRLGPVFVTARGLGRHGALIERAAAVATGLYEIPEHVMGRISDVEAPQGIAALCSFKEFALPELALSAPIVVLDALADPGNVGTIIRTAEASGAGGVIVLAGTADPFSQKALRASAGAALRLPVVRASCEDIGGLVTAGLRLLVAEPRGGVMLFEADLRPPVALVFGNEAHGAGDAIRAIATGEFSIPLSGGSESLNVAAAAAVALFEALRQRRG